MTQTSTDQMEKLQAKATAEAGTADGPADTSLAVRESLSALVDSEASEIELHRVLKLAESDPEIRSGWRRYQLIRSVLKGELEVDPRLDLSQRISAAIADEESLAVGGRLRQWRDGLGKVAIAASVTVVFILGAQQIGRGNLQEPAQTAESSVPALGEPVEVAVGAPSGFELPSFAARTVSTEAGNISAQPQGSRALPTGNRYPQAINHAQLRNNQALQNHFDRLLIRHAERSSSNGSMGLIPFARVSNMEAAQE